MEKSEVTLNRSQALIKIVKARKTILMAPRGNGKTFAIGDHIEEINEDMPGSQILLLSDTFKRLTEKIVPNICDYFINHAGMVEGEDFVLYRKPPAHFKKPIVPLYDFEHVVPFASGMSLCLVSGHVEGSANAYNAQAMVIDESKFVNQSHVKQASLVLRGKNKEFGHLPLYRSMWFFTDKYPVPGSNIKWLLNEKNNSADPKLIESIIKLQLHVINPLTEQINAMGDDPAANPLIRKRNKLLSDLDAVRRNLTYFCDGLPMENIVNLGEMYYRDQKRELSDYEYRIAILNEDPYMVENAFYPTLHADRHYHSRMDDIDLDSPLAISLDWNWRITPMVVAQYTKLPGNEYRSLNFVSGIHTLSDGGIEATCRMFAEQFSCMRCKVVFFYFDHTAIGRKPDGDQFYVTVIKQLKSLGWGVQEAYIGKASEHHIRFEIMKEEMSRQGEGSMMFNQYRCKYLLLSMQQAGAILSNGETKKDKRPEKKGAIPPEEATDYSEAFDILVAGHLQQPLLKTYNGSSGAGGVSIR